jgi:protein disulfide-isomerase A1
MKYRQPAESTLLEFLTQHTEKKLSPFFKSAPRPETNDEPVKVVVGDTFEEMIFNSEKHVLLEAYAP